MSSDQETVQNNEELVKKVSEYIQAEVEVSIKDYDFIKKLNETATQSFRDYTKIAEKIGKNVDRINKNQEAREQLNKLTEAIDNIDTKVTALETMAFKIDSYSRRLEIAFKNENNTGNRTIIPQNTQFASNSK